jgi:hypothetical protein
MIRVQLGRIWFMGFYILCSDLMRCLPFGIDGLFFGVRGVYSVALTSVHGLVGEERAGFYLPR